MINASFVIPMMLISFSIGGFLGIWVSEASVFIKCNEKGVYEISDSKFIECAAIDLKAIYTKGRE